MEKIYCYNCEDEEEYYLVDEVVEVKNIRIPTKLKYCSVCHKELYDIEKTYELMDIINE